MLRVRLLVSVLLLAALAPVPSHAQSREVFYTDFDSPAGAPSEFSGITTLHSVDRLTGFGPKGNQFAGNLLHNPTGNSFNGSAEGGGRPTVFTLAGLPAHTSVDLNFLLGVINTWDAPTDVLEVRVDGKPVFVERFDFAMPERQTYVSPPGGLLTPRRTDGFFPDRGFGNTWGDAAYNMALEPAFHNIPHTGPLLNVEIFTHRSFQGSDNESWGIDNFQVVLNGVVPEPGSAALALTPLGALLLGRRAASRRAPCGLG